jgi:Heparinase II/III-like protein/Heparinase II/III N-terminus
VPSTARRLWSRLSSMSWDELETRSRQELSKRLDLTMHRIGLQPRRNGLGYASKFSGNFFFSTNEIPRRVSLLREYLPHEAKEIVTESDEICRHRFRLLGYRELQYGDEIDWHLDAAHAVRSPLKPWFKINLLDFCVVGDHKVTWELNRHQHLVTLAKAWRLTNDDAYAREIPVQWYSWQRANPYPLGVNWASALEVAFRSLSWVWVHHLLAECPIVPANFQNDLLCALALNGRHIERYLSTYFSPNTHLLGEAMALFFIGAIYPQIPSAEKWKSKGWRIIQEQAQRQVLPDGIYFEQSLYYHVYALDFLLHARLLASRNDLPISSEFDLVIRRMLAVVQALVETSPADGFGDDDGGRVFKPGRNRAEHMTDPLALGAALFQDESLRTNSTVTEEAIWLFGERAVSSDVSRRNSTCKTKSQFFRDGGLYIARSCEAFSQQMVIDAGPQGTGQSGHGHADALSVKLAFCNRSWLVDAGTFCYVGPGNQRNAFRGTRAHNTMAVDGLDQAEPEGPFAWSSIPDTRVEQWIAGTTFTLFEGSHSGYERLAEPVRHRRFVFHLNGSFWLVRDVATGNGLHRLETSWHFAPDLVLFNRGSSFMAGAAQSKSADHDGSNQLILRPVADPEWQSELGSDDISPVYGAKQGACVVRCSARLEVPAEHAVLLIPAVGGMQESGEFFRHDLQPGDAGMPEVVYRYEQGDTAHSMIFCQKPRTTWKFGPWRSDARFLYFRLKNRRLDHLVFCEGSFAQLCGENLISHDVVLQWLEWTKLEGHDQLVCSNEISARSFSANILRSEILI